MNSRPDAKDDRLWKRLRHRGAPIKQQVLSELPKSAAPFGDVFWQTFKQQCAAEGGILPELIGETEPQGPDLGMFRRRGPRKPRGSNPFEDLPPAERAKAEAEFRRLCDNWAGDLPSWRRAILTGVARRLVLHPPDSDWGRRMRRIKGGIHCQRKYREQGWHPLATLNQAMARRHSAEMPPQAMAKRQDQTADSQGYSRSKSSPTSAEAARARLGITPQQMRGIPRITPRLRLVEGGIEGVVEALRWSPDPAAVAFLHKHDSVPRADLQHLSMEEICVAAGVDTRQVFTLAVHCVLYLCLSEVQLELFGDGLTQVLKAAIKYGRTEKGWRDRQAILIMAGLVPAPKGWTCPLLLPGAGARRTEAPPAKTAWSCTTAPRFLRR